MLASKEVARRLNAAQKLLLEPTTTRDKFSFVRTLIAGLNPNLDAKLAELDKHFSTWDKLESGDVISLSAEHLPENTEEEKKRKKWLLLFINSWKQLGSEVERVQAEMAAQEGSQTDVSTWTKILKSAKGPLGLVTVVAVGIVALQQTSVEIIIKNEGCPTLIPSSVPISVPGLSLPTEPLQSGETATATIPGLSVSIDGTTPGTLSLSAPSFSLTFRLPVNIQDITFDGNSLLKKKIKVQLSEKEEHVIILQCL